MKKNAKNLIKDLISFLDASPTAFHATTNIIDKLDAFGFERLDETKEWHLENGGKYFVQRNSSAVIAFKMGEKSVAKSGFRIAGAHTDSPLLKIKENSEKKTAGTIRLTTEVYGGPLLYTWLDRDLSIAGRVVLKYKKEIYSKLVDLKKNIAIIPSLAIHLNREANKGFEFNKQNHLQAILTVNETKPEGYLKHIIADEIKKKEEEILSYDLFLYDTQKATISGLNEELFSSGRIDNLSMCHSILESLISAKNSQYTTVGLFFDNEEIGSRTMMGADSDFASQVLQRIVSVTEKHKDSWFQTIANSFLISADGAHTLHPNFVEKHDSNFAPLMNKGPVIKMSSSFRYSTTAESSAFFEELCNKNNVPVQKLINRSDVPSGSTIGPISSAHLGIKSVDVGNAMWAMHSIRETAGVLDHFYMTKVLKSFFSGDEI